MHPDADEAQAQIRRMVRERRTAGDYSADLEHDLDRYYREIMVGLARETERVVAIRMALEQIGDPAQFGQDRISTSSRTVFGRLVHKVVARLAVRQVHGITAQLREHAIWVHTAIENLTEIIESIDEVERSTINRRLASIVERLTILEEDRRRSDDLAARQ
jgi:hypothetical protein|tara:strand:- start:2691 stop:3173 length:483 start_codon:yes stop_codon:yes gene_type:complete